MPPEMGFIAKCKFIILGKLFAIGAVSIYSDGILEPVAQTVGTYVIPPVNKT